MQAGTWLGKKVTYQVTCDVESHSIGAETAGALRNVLGELGTDRQVKGSQSPHSEQHSLVYKAGLGLLVLCSCH